MPSIENGTKVATPFEQYTMNKCWANPSARNCVDCPCSMDNGGTCCFGDEDRYDGDTDPCDSCPHHNDCEEVVWESYEPPHRNTAFSKFSSGGSTSHGLVKIGGLRRPTTSKPAAATRPKAKRPVSTAVVKPRMTGRQIVVAAKQGQQAVVHARPMELEYAAPRGVVAQIIEMEEEPPTDESRGVRFMKDVAQGGVEGLLEAALYHVRRWRW